MSLSGDRGREELLARPDKTLGLCPDTGLPGLGPCPVPNGGVPIPLPLKYERIPV